MWPPSLCLARRCLRLSMTLCPAAPRKPQWPRRCAARPRRRLRVGSRWRGAGTPRHPAELAAAPDGGTVLHADRLKLLRREWAVDLHLQEDATLGGAAIEARGLVHQVQHQVATLRDLRQHRLTPTPAHGLGVRPD